MAIASSPSVNYTPSATKTPTPENFLPLSQMSYLRNELPHQLSKVIEQRYGSQVFDSFLTKKGMKVFLKSDAAQWQEENRLAQAAFGVTRVGDVFTSTNHTFRIGEVLTVMNADGSVQFKGIITAVTQNSFTASSGNTGVAGWSTLATSNLTCYTGTNEHKKGVATELTSLNTTYETFTVRPTIVRELVADNRSNLAQASWLQTTMQDGSVGYVWFDVNVNSTEMRFLNAREHNYFNSEDWTGDAAALGYQGSKGLLQQLGNGNIYSGLVSTVVDVDNMIDRLDKQGQLPENTIYGTTKLCFGFDNFLASLNVQAMQYGYFDNAENTKLNLSFKGFSRGSYAFNYGGLRYFNDPTGMGLNVGLSKTNGMLIPNGSARIKDTLTGEASQKPMIHALVRNYNGMNRDYEHVIRDWKQGTLKTDTVEHEFLSEQAVAVIGVNNTILFKAA